MPIAYSFYRTPKGHEVAKLVSSGRVTAEEATDFAAKTDPGGPYAGKPMLIIVEKSTDITTEARRIFTTVRNPDVPRLPVAMITPNAALRVVVNFMTRVSGGEANTRMFPTEPDGVTWLDSQLSG